MTAMPAELVHPAPAGEIPGWARSMTAGFLGDPHDAAAQRRIDQLAREWEPSRAWGARDHGRWVATLRTETRTLTVPGDDTTTRDVEVDALTNVTVSATHRRLGLMRAMLEQSLQAAWQRGDPLSILIAAEWPIYGRFGYAPAVLSADYVLHRTRIGATVTGEPRRVRHVERDEFGDLAAQVYALARRRRPGQIDRSETWWNRVLGRDGYTPSPGLPHHWLIHESDDGPDGLLGWKAQGDGGLIPPLGRVTVWDLAAASDEADRNLWAYLAGIDGSDEVHLPLRPVDEPARWLLHDARTLVMTQNVDFVWLRLLDVPTALSSRAYAVAGEVVLEVSDDDAGGFAAGRYRLCADGVSALCERTGDPADLELTQRALASIYLGGFRLPGLALGAGGLRERTPGALARIDAMFATGLAPWNATWF
jgi:predicted acetyltransferase